MIELGSETDRLPRGGKRIVRFWTRPIGNSLMGSKSRSRTLASLCVTHHHID